jgi:hypothetical protein
MEVWTQSVHRIQSGGKKKGKVERGDRDYIYPPEANTNDKLVKAADVAPGVKRFRR